MQTAIPGPRKPAVIKRLIDVILSATMLVVLAPVFVVVACGVKLAIGSPALFRQVRPGLHGKPFELVKFRTMLSLLDPDGCMLPDSLRLTKFGSFLRSTSLDEIPEFWNVLRGDMSLVGPRPLLVEYMEIYSARQNRRHEVRPGITGWAQVNGRNMLDWEEKFELDVWYVENQSLLLDLRILWLTLAAVLSRRGITDKGQVSAERFDKRRS